MVEIPEYSMEFLLSYNGRRHVLKGGYFLKFEVRRVKKTTRVPHGIAYAFTLHDSTGVRVMGYDNSHLVGHKGSKFVRPPIVSDHVHVAPGDKGRPYEFVSAEQLLTDFLTDVERVLAHLGMEFAVVSDQED